MAQIVPLTLTLTLKIDAESTKEAGVEQYAMRAFGDALEYVPIALAENSGFSPIEVPHNTLYSRTRDRS